MYLALKKSPCPYEMLPRMRKSQQKVRFFFFLIFTSHILQLSA